MTENICPALSDGDLWRITQIAAIGVDSTLNAILRTVSLVESHPIADPDNSIPELAPLQSRLESLRIAAICQLRNYLIRIGVIQGETVDFDALKGYCQSSYREDLQRRRTIG